jgi:acetoin utilization deacetylase AcuC-like enzyme
VSGEAAFVHDPSLEYYGFGEDHPFRPVRIRITIELCESGGRLRRSLQDVSKIPFGKQLDMEPMTVPLAELLLTNLQIVELNEKDVLDALAVLHDHPVGDGDGDWVNGERIAALCAADWGLWRTFTANLQATGERLERYDLPEEGKQRIADHIQEL